MIKQTGADCTVCIALNPTDILYVMDNLYLVETELFFGGGDQE